MASTQTKRPLLSLSPPPLSRALALTAVPPVSYRLRYHLLRYALDDEMSAKLRKSNPEAFQNVLKRLLEAKGRGYWDPDDDVLERIQQQYADVEDDIELGTGGR